MKKIKVIAKSENPKTNSVMNILNALENSKVSYFLIDTKNNIAQFTENLYTNFAIKKLKIFDVGKMFSFIIPEDKVEFERYCIRFSETLETEEPFRISVYRKNNIPQWIHISLRKIEVEEEIYTIVTLADITDSTNNQYIVEACVDGIYIGDLVHNVALFEGEFYDDIGIKQGITSNSTHSINNKIFKEDVAFHNKYVSHLVEKRSEINRSEYRYHSKSNKPLWAANRGRMFFKEHNNPAIVMGGIINIDNFHYYNHFIESRLDICSITGLPNRNKLLVDLASKKDVRGENGFIILIHIDDFKKVKDFIDPVVANSFLQSVAQVLLKNTLCQANVYHNEMENFVMVLPNATVHDAERQMKQIEEATKDAFVWRNISFPYKISMAGVAYNCKTVDHETIFEKLNITLSKISAEGNPRYLIYKGRIEKEYKERLSLEHRLRESIAQMSNFFIVYQPFVRAETGRCIGAEALLRWRDIDGRVIPPTVFIPIIEEMGLMDVVGSWIFEQAAKQCKCWIDSGIDPDFYISVNVSPTQLINGNIAGLFLQYLDSISLPPQNMQVEITENVMIMDVQHGMKQLNVLKKSGMRLAIDDFGTGYSSLSYLKNLPVDKIKIDKSFIQDIESSNFSREFISSMIGITQILGCVSCVEGVETQYQMEFLKNIKSDIFQGYYFGRPQMSKDCENTFLLKKKIDDCYS